MNISSKYSYPEAKNPGSKSWYNITNGEEKIKEVLKGRVEYHDMKNQHILRIKDVRRKDSAEYKFRLTDDQGKRKESDFPGVTLVVTGNSDV